MTFNLLDLVGDSKLAIRRENKKKLHKLLDKYGSVEDIERSGDLRDGFELDFARIDGALDEVLEERCMGYYGEKGISDSLKDSEMTKGVDTGYFARQNSGMTGSGENSRMTGRVRNSGMTKNEDGFEMMRDNTLISNVKHINLLLPDDEDFSLEGLNLTDRQRKSLKNMDMSSLLNMIKILREQQGVEKAKSKKESESQNERDILREKVDKKNSEIHVVDNEYEGKKIEKDVEGEDVEEKELKIDYSKYGKGFSREFIDELVLDDEFNKIVKDYLNPNEGGYNNDEDDSGGETNMGISKNTYKNEDVKNMTRERANAIFYKDFYKINGLNNLPYKIRGFIVDFGVLSSPINAIRMVHKILNLSPKGTIIGKDTLDKLKNFTQKDYEVFLEKYKSEMIKYFCAVAEKNPTKKKFLKGWIDRAKRAHLAE